MVFSGPVNYRHLLSATCASAITLGVVAAPAEAAVDPIGRECKAATAAAKQGQPIPNIGNFVFGPNENVIDGNLVRIYAPDKYKPYITKATDQWTSATGGLIRFEYVNQPGYKVVTVREANLGGYVVGRVQGTVDNMQLLLNPDILRNGYTDSLVMTITHELGHAMGLAHSCDGALMKDGSNRGKVATTLQPLDVQVLIQANNLRQYGGRPVTTTTAAPAPATTTAAPEPQTLEKAQAALADANSALTAAQRNLDAAQAKYDAIPEWQILSRAAAEQDVNAAQGRVARAQSAVQSAEALVEKFSPTPASEAPTASPTTAVQTAAPATTSEPSIVYVTETVPAPEPTVEPTSEMPKPVTSTVVVEDEPTPETTSSEAEPTTSDTQVALPKPTSLREAQQAFEVAQAEYVAALDALQVARVTGIGLAKAQEEIANALAAYGQASENRREYIAAHPDEVLETTSNQQPSAPSEPSEPSPTTTSAPSSEEPAPSSTVPTSAPSPVGAATSTQQPSQAPSTTTTQKTTATSVSTPAQSSTKQPTSSEAAATSAPSTVQAVTPAQETTSTVTTTRTAAQQSTATRATTPVVSTSSTTTKRVSMAPSSTTQKTTAISVSTPAQSSTKQPTSSSSTPASSEAAATSAPSTVQAATPAPQATPTSTRETTPELSTSSTMPSSSEISTSATTSANSLTSSTSASTTKPQESEAAGTTVASISEEHTSTSKPGYVIEITGEHRATTIQVGPTRAPISATTSREPATTAKQAPAATTKVATSTEPAAATQPQSSTSAPAISRETSTVNVDITVTNGDLRDVKEGDAVTNGGSPVAAIIIPVVALLLAALGATGWAHMNGLF